MAKKKKKAGLLLSDADLKKRYPTSGLASLIAVSLDNTLVLPSRILAVNYHMNGGLYYGKIVEEYGEESTGKTLLANDFAVVCQTLGGIVLWNDAEASFSAHWAQLNGINLDRLVLLPDENEIETISDWQADQIIYWRSKLTNNEPILLVVDSTAALETRDNIEAADTDSGEDMGRRSKKIYQMLRKRNKLYARYGVCVIYINQVRKKVNAGMYEDPDTTPGGMAMRFYASQRLGLYRGKRINLDVKDKKSDVIGHEIFIRTKKSKVGPPRPSIRGRVFFEETEAGGVGYDKYFGFPELLVELGIVKRKQAIYKYKGEIIAKGDENFLKVLKNNTELRQKLIKKAGINTVSSTRKKLDSINKNLYPVKLRISKPTDGEDN